MIAFVTFGVLLPFFYYNVFGDINKRRKIFMGDTGSLTLGYIISFLVIKYSMFNPDVMPYQHGAIIIAFSTLIIPMFDVVRVVIVRARLGKGLFAADKNHIHHKFLAIGFTPRTTLVAIFSIAVFFILLNSLLCQFLNSTIILLIDAISWIGLHMCLNKVVNKREKRNVLENFKI
jgi:UDP-N-acetylmuramyl pentapeptide phosphotransferase/UDP-N-acetylglucosamine-1-phosphate transferase